MKPTPRSPALMALTGSRSGRTFIPAHLLGTASPEGAPDVLVEPAADSATLERLSGRLHDFAGTLSPREKSALFSILDLAAPDAAFTALAATPAAAILDEDDIPVFEALRAEPAPAGGGARPFTVMIMKATRLCNLRCQYCYQWRDGPNQVMPFPVLARAIRDILRAPGVRRVEFVWHGGEATLLPIHFYRTALWLQQQFLLPGQVVDNVIQTNATRVTDDWLDFWRRYQFSVGVSLDGPPEIHDRRRLDVAGRPTSARVRLGLERLRAAGIGHGVLMVVDDQIMEAGPQRLVDHLLEIGVSQVDLLNVLPRNTEPGASLEGMYLSWPRYVEFLREMFRAWWPEHVERISIRELAGLVQQLTGGPAFTCVFAGDCFGGFLTIEPSGEVSACDKYVDDADYRFGHLLETGLASLGVSRRLAEVRRENAAAVERMRGCRWFEICQGACPHDRYTGRRHRPEGDQRCCGMSPLFEEMSAALGAARLPLHPAADAWVARTGSAHPSPGGPSFTMNPGDDRNRKA